MSPMRISASRPCWRRDLLGDMTTNIASPVNQRYALFSPLTNDENDVGSMIWWYYFVFSRFPRNPLGGRCVARISPPPAAACIAVRVAWSPSLVPQDHFPKDRIGSDALVGSEAGEVEVAWPEPKRNGEGSK